LMRLVEAIKSGNRLQIWCQIPLCIAFLFAGNFFGTAASEEDVVTWFRHGPFPSDLGGKIRWRRIYWFGPMCNFQSRFLFMGSHLLRDVRRDGQRLFTIFFWRRRNIIFGGPAEVNTPRKYSPWKWTRNIETNHPERQPPGSPTNRLPVSAWSKRHEAWLSQKALDHGRGIQGGFDGWIHNSTGNWWHLLQQRWPRWIWEKLEGSSASRAQSLVGSIWGGGNRSQICVWTTVPSAETTSWSFDPIQSKQKFNGMNLYEPVAFRGLGDSRWEKWFHEINFLRSEVFVALAMITLFSIR